jgi:hypothetical protein
MGMKNVTLISNLFNINCHKQPLTFTSTFYLFNCSMFINLFLLNLSFHLTFSTLWSICYFWAIFYLFGVFITVLYLLSNLKTYIHLSTHSTRSNFYYLAGYDLYWLFLTPTILFFLINLTWVSPTILPWFGHLTFSAFQYKVSYLTLFLFLLTVTTYVTTFKFTSKEVYDYTIVLYSLFV